ncbi:TSC22 domain family protein 1-like [Mixophyes fleayi]|uniref:TSC22 domain family protein 1-like n=1 Tax=Mixophyes fleayi TaxID=3061075 RepID=UPI003F4E13A9
MACRRSYMGSSFSCARTTYCSSGAKVVAIDNKIEQAMDLVKSHLMYAVQEEVKVLKEQIKQLIKKNSTLERENALLKSLSNSDQLSQLSVQGAPGACEQQPPVTTAPLTATQTAHPPQQPTRSGAKCTAFSPRSAT